MCICYNFVINIIIKLRKRLQNIKIAISTRLTIMSNKKSANMILSRTRRNQIYLPFLRKKKYFDAIAAGDADRITTLSQENY